MKAETANGNSFTLHLSAYLTKIDVRRHALFAPKSIGNDAMADAVHVNKLKTKERQKHQLSQ
jgi:hypothetical protein